MDIGYNLPYRVDLSWKEVEVAMVTMKDVALKAGVALGTVSRVVNNNSGVKEATRMKVEKAIKELNYRPNEAARNFKMQQSQTIALIIPTIWHPFYSEFAYYVERKLSHKGYKTILCNSKNDVDREIDYINMLEKNKIDGIIAITYSKVIDQYISSRLPIISIDRHFTEGVVTVTSDNYEGGKIAAQELVKRGCNNLAYFGSISPIKNESMLRSKGFEDYMKKVERKALILEVSEPVKDLDSTIHKFIEKNPEIDGVFAMNDKWARTTIKVLRKMNRNVPEDVQVIGFDGAKMSKEESISHSTIRQPIDQLAKTSVQELLNIISGNPGKSKIILPVTFYEGNSTKNSLP